MKLVQRSRISSLVGFFSKLTNTAAVCPFKTGTLKHCVETTEVATTVIHIGKKDYDEFRVVLPPEDILVEFEAVSKPIFDRIVEGQLENRRLTKLRNGLLPKLMSGELDVSYLNV